MRYRHLLLSTALAFAAMPLLAAEQAAPRQAPATPATQTTAPAAPVATSSAVVRAQFTSAVENHEPVDNITTLANDKTRIYFFSELRGLAGQKVVQRWEHDGKVMYEAPFDIGGARWRIFSSKTLDPSWTGEWKVSIIDGAGATLSVSTFSYTAAAKEKAPAAESAPAAPAGTTPAQAPAKTM